MDPDQQLRNLRDFLLVYNRMTEICFQRCSSNFNYRNLTMDEERCVDSCAGKLIRANHRLMGTYVQLMPKMVQRRMEEMESKAAQNAKAAEAAAASADVAPPATEAIVASQNPITSSLSTQEPPQLTPSVADVRSEAHGSFLGLDAPVDLNPPVSNSTTTPEVILPAAATLTNVSEPVYPSVLNDTGNGPSYRTGSPQSPIAGAQTEFESSVPVLMPSKPTSISADGPVATVAAPTVSTESLSGQERAPELPPMSNQ